MKTPSFQQQQMYYRALWKDWKRLYLDEKCRKRFVLGTVSRVGKKPLRILDVGCGRGWLTSELSLYGDVLGVDFSVKEARERYPILSFQEANIVFQFPEGVYDIVISSEVIEHLPQEHQTGHIKNIANVLSQDGVLILTTPNKPHAEKLARLSSDTSYLQPLENWLNREELRAMIEPYFTIVRFGSARFYPPFLFSNILFRAPYHVFYDYLGGYRLIDKLFESTDWGTYFTLIGRKK